MTTVTATPARVRRRPGRVLEARRIVLAAVVLGVVAATLRLVLVLHGGGIAGTGNYDDGVYFGASEAFVHGRLPYRDFLFLQPPGILVALAPFALLAPLVGDAHAFEIARLAGYLFAGATTALLVLAVRRVGLTAAVATGIVFAVIEPAVFTSRSTLLEPVGAFVTAAVLAVFGGAPPAGRRGRVLAVLCGVLLGFSIAVKIWAIVQTAVFLIAARRRHPLPMLVGAVAAAVLLFLPLFVVDPAAMWRQVVTDQLGRPRLDPVLLDRLADVVQTPPLTGSALRGVTAVVLVIVVVLGVAGWRYPIARLASVQFAAAVALLLAGPSFYDHYAELATPFLAVVVGAGIAGLVRQVRVRRVRRGVSGAAIVIVAAYCAIGLVGSGGSFMLNPKVGTALVTRVQALPGCVVADDPTILVLTDRLGPDLARGCPFWPDLTGWSLDADRQPAGTDPATALLADDPAYQRRMARYLSSGDAVVLSRAKGRLSAATIAQLGPLRRVEHGRYLVTATP